MINENAEVRVTDMRKYLKKAVLKSTVIKGKGRRGDHRLKTIS